MKSDVETLSPTRVKLTVEVPYEELKPSLDATVKAIGAQLNVPGFRPGKVPSRLIEQRVGRGTIIQEAVNQSLPDLYSQAVAEAEIRPLGQPEVDITDVPVDGEGPLVFTAELDVRPQIELPDYAAISVEVDALDDEALDAGTQVRLDDLRERFGSLTSVDRPAQIGDHVVIDLRGVVDGTEVDSVTGVSYEVGSQTMLDGLDEAVTGLSADEQTTFTAALVAGEHEGEEAEITVTVTAVKVRELPELDDDFAQMASEFDTLGELVEDVRGQARRAKRFEQGVQARDKLLDQLLDALDIPVPEAAIESEVHGHLEREGRLDDDEHRAEVDTDTRRSLRQQLLLDTIAEKEEIEITQQELIEFLITTAQQYGMEPSQLAQVLDDGNQVPVMAAEVARRKALTLVLERITVVDSAGAVLELGDEDEDAGAEGDVGEAPGAGGGESESAEAAATAGEDEDADATAPSHPD